MDASIHRNLFVVFVQTVTAMVSHGLEAFYEPTQLPIDLAINPALMTVVGVDLDVLGNPVPPP